MYTVIAIINNYSTILCEKINDSSDAFNFQYRLPIFKATSEKLAQKGLKKVLKQIDINFRYDEVISSFEKNNEKFLIYKCSIQSYTLHFKNTNFMWKTINEFLGCQASLEDNSTDKWLNKYFSKFLDLETNIINDFNKICEQSAIKIDVQFSLDTIVIFLRGQDACCPFALNIDYKINEDIVSYQVSWRMVRLLSVPGDKTDMCIYFLSSMAVLFKLVYGLPVYAFTYNSIGFDFEIDAGGICIESNICENEININAFPAIAN